MVYYQMHLHCVFLDQKVKITISKMNWDGFFQNMTAIKQHAIVEKERVRYVFFSFFPLFMSWLEFKAYGDASHVL